MPAVHSITSPAIERLEAAAWAIDRALYAAESNPASSAARIERLNAESRDAWAAVNSQARVERQPVSYDADGMALADDVVQAAYVAAIHAEASSAHYDALVLQMQVRRDYMRGAAA